MRLCIAAGYVAEMNSTRCWRGFVPAVLQCTVSNPSMRAHTRWLLQIMDSSLTIDGLGQRKQVCKHLIAPLLHTLAFGEGTLGHGIPLQGGPVFKRRSTQDAEDRCWRLWFGCFLEHPLSETTSFMPNRPTSDSLQRSTLKAETLNLKPL